MTEIGEQITHPVLKEYSNEIIGLPSCRLSTTPVTYPEAVSEMEAHIAAMRTGEHDELLWFLEHPPLYTAGTGAQESDLLSPENFRSLNQGAAGNLHITGRDNVLSMSCSTSTKEGAMSDVLFSNYKIGLSMPSMNVAFRPELTAPISASGLTDRILEKIVQIKSQPLVSD